MKMPKSIWRMVVQALILGAGLLVISGCATTDDSENLSERPWNTPKSWEGGLPTGMMEGR